MTHPTPDRGALARAVAAAAAATPGVARLAGGPGVQIATHYPGGTVVGVALTTDLVSVHLVVDRVPMEPVTTAVIAAVRAVLSALRDARRVQVVVEDVDDSALGPANPAAPPGGGR